MKRIAALWVFGIIVIVPWCAYRLLFQADTSEYALLIVLPLFWIFGFWGVVGPFLAIARVRRGMRLMESLGDREARERLLSADGEAMAIRLMAEENRIPRPLAKWIYSRFRERLLAGRQSTP